LVNKDFDSIKMHSTTMKILGTYSTISRGSPNDVPQHPARETLQWTILI